jgi:HD-like signal output (HDOD) protein
MSFRNKILARLDSLDIIISPPPAVDDVLNLMGEEGPGIRPLLLSILKDTGISERIIEMANSPFYDYEGRVNNVDQALMILGDNLVKCLVFSILIHDHVIAKCPGKDKEYNRLWLHFLETASAARNLGFILKFESADEAYIAGLIHDLGRLFLLAYFGSEAFQVSRLVSAGMTLLDAEREHLGIDHQEIGKLVARRWNLPGSLRQIMGDHHPRNASDLNEMTPLSRIVSLSDSLSLSSGEYSPDADGAAARIEIVETCCRFMNLKVDDIKRIYATLPDDVLSSAAALDLGLGDAARYLSELNSEMLEIVFELGNFIGKRQAPARSASKEGSNEDVSESLRTALSTLSHYVSHSLTAISGQFEMLRIMLEKEEKEEISDRLPAISESLGEFTDKITGILQDLSSIAGGGKPESLERTRAFDIEKSKREKTKKDI